MRGYKHAFAAAFVVLMGLQPASAQDATYQPVDANLMQQCFEAVRDQSVDAETGTRASYMDCIGAASGVCQDEKPENSSTVGMVNCMTREITWWDEQLNLHYGELKAGLELEEFDKLRAAQRAWLTYRDAKCGFEYFYWREGTIRSIMGVSCNLEETARRTLDLQGVLDWMNL